MDTIIQVDGYNDTLITYYQHSFRSDFKIRNVRHCFESTYISGCKGFHTGFSPSQTERTFISYWGQNSGNKTVFAERSESFDKQISNELTINLGESVMVCLDSKRSLITAKINNEEKKLHFPNIKNTKTWYAYIDAGSNCKYPSSASVKVNLGKKKFNNTMPVGYAPFVYFCDMFPDNICTRASSRVSLLLNNYIVFILTSSR